MTEEKPVIGVSSSFSGKEYAETVTINQSYLEAVRQAGGIPLVIPVDASEEEMAFLLDQCDGMVLTGGVDIDPRLYGEEILNDSVSIAPVRDRGEKILCALAEERGFPILGICRGVQYLNVYYGGDLYQDIPTQRETEIAHRMAEPHRRTCHRCLLEADSPLRDLLGTDEIYVNRHHDQAVRKVAPGFRVMARCDDGIIEAIWKPDHKFLWGLQWHPEKIWDMDEPSARIFRAFVDACR